MQSKQYANVYMGVPNQFYVGHSDTLTKMQATQIWHICLAVYSDSLLRMQAILPKMFVMGLRRIGYDAQLRI